MLTLFREGGFPIWFLLSFSVLALISGARFALRPGTARLQLTMATGLATLFTTLTSICADLAQVGHHAPEYLARHPKEPLAHVLLQGLAEALSPAILGFTVLTLSALFVGLGLFRGSPEA